MKSKSSLVWSLVGLTSLAGAFVLGACAPQQEPITDHQQSSQAAPSRNLFQQQASAPRSEPSAIPTEPSSLVPNPEAVSEAPPISQPNPGESPLQVQAEPTVTPTPVEAILEPLEPKDIEAKAHAEIEKSVQSGNPGAPPTTPEQAYFGGLASTDGVPLYSDQEALAKSEELQTAGLELETFRQMHDYLAGIQNADESDPQARLVFKDRVAVDKALELSKQGYNLDSLKRTTEFFSSLVDPQTHQHLMPAMGALESALNVVRAPNSTPDWLISRYHQILPNAAGPREALDQIFGEVGR